MNCKTAVLYSVHRSAFILHRSKRVHPSSLFGKMPVPLTPSALRFHPMEAAVLVARLALSLSFLLASFSLPVSAQTAAPQAEPAVVRLAGLKKGVKVRRDERGIPYVEAEDELDL